MRLLSILCVALLLVASASAKGHHGRRNKHHDEQQQHPEPQQQQQQKQAPRNLIYLISDGYGVGAQTMTREVKEALGLGPQAADDILLGVARTKSAEVLVTDSASSATSLSCGIKTLRGAIAEDVNGAPCRTIMEAAVDAGYKTGVVATSRVADATPASFTAHAPNRGLLEIIALQQVYAGVDILLGGGRDVNSQREDGRDLFLEASTILNYTTVENTAEFRQATSLPLLGLFTQSHMSQEIDRVEADEPSLSEMVFKALVLLERAAEVENTGFFLMVEGSNIDKRFHEMDTIGATYDAIEYDAVVRIALNFARSRSDTVVVSTSDHETRGCTLGNIGSIEHEWYPEKFAQIKSSALFMAQRFLNGGEPAAAILASSTDFPDEPFTAEEIRALTEAATGASEFDASIAFSELLNTRLNVGYGALDHSGEDVAVFGYGPGVERIRPVTDNTELPQILADLFGWEIGTEAANTEAARASMAAKIERMGPTTSALAVHKDEVAAHNA